MWTCGIAIATQQEMLAMHSITVSVLVESLQIDPRRRRVGMAAPRRRADLQRAARSSTSVIATAAENADGDMGGAPAGRLHAPIDQRRPDRAADIIAAGDDGHRQPAIALEPVRGLRHQRREGRRGAEPDQEMHQR